MLKVTRDVGLDDRPPLFPIEARALTVVAGGEARLDAVDLVLDGAKRTVVMGPNGAGKSLLLRLMHGLIAPSSGQILWAGVPADASVRGSQAMVFQRPVLLRRSARANIAFVLADLAPSLRATRVEAILARARLLDVAHSPARALSGGEQQRLAIARALAQAPKILFLDEPTAHLDPAATQSVEDLIGQAAAEGTKIILVTHDAGQARRLGDEIVFLHRGRVAEQTAADAFFRKPRSAAAQAYLEGRIPL